MDDRKNVLFLCTRNSARSQMAEALLKSKVGDHFHVYSAGLVASRVHPLVPIVMEEVGIDVAGQRSKHVKEFLGRTTAHYLIIVCAHAEEHCPRMFPGVGERLFWPFDDPAAADGSDDDRLEAFRRVRDEIDAKLTAWLETIHPED